MHQKSKKWGDEKSLHSTLFLLISAREETVKIRVFLFYVLTKLG